MDSNISRIIPRPVVVPTKDKQRKEDRAPFQVTSDDAPPGEDESISEPRVHGDRTIGQAENAEAGRRLDVTA